MEYSNFNLEVMKAKDRSLGLAVILIGSVCLNVLLLTRKPAVIERIETHTDTIIQRDTMPNEESRNETGGIIYVTIPNNSIGAMSQSCDTVPHGIDMIDTAIQTDSGLVIALPEEQAVYSDSLYTAWVSGFRPKLDSIHLRIPHTTTTITRIETAHAPQLAIGPTIGVGYGIGGRKADIFVGVSATYNLWKK